MGKRLDGLGSKGKQIIVLVVIAVLVFDLLYVVSTFFGSDKPEDASAELSIPLGPQSDVTSMSWKTDGTDYSITLRDGTWYNDADAEYPVNQTTVDTMITALKNMYGCKEIDKVTDLTQYGLNEPQAAVTVNGDTTYQFGTYSTISSAYYVCLNDTSTVYLVKLENLDAFTVDDAGLLQKETIKGFGSPTGLTLQNSSGEFTLVKGDDGNWSDGAGKVTLDQNKAKTLVSTVTGSAWLTCVNYKATDEELAECGLSAPTASVILSDADHNTAIFCYGTDTDGGTYACFDGSHMIYLVSTDTVDTFRNTTLDSLKAE